MIRYEDFGAVGDGKTNDYFAIKAAHKAANEGGEEVAATPGKCYYISDIDSESIVIKTDTTFTGASFIIDETYLSAYDEKTCPRSDIFRVENDYPEENFDQNSSFIKSINENSPAIKRKGGTKRLGEGLGYPALLMVYNDENTQYLRFGFKNDVGSPQKEIFFIDENGFIDENTPALFDFEKVTRVVAVRCDTKPIRIEGGTITTIASRMHNDSENYCQVEHGFMILRPNTTVSGMTHYVKDQIPKGEIINGKPFFGFSSYGFYKADFTNNIEFRDCFATPRITYAASYEIMLCHSNNVRLINVRESEETYNEPKYWWIMGSNFCKNITYDNCYLSRFDAHRGVYNTTIKNSTVASLRLTGGGDFTIENSTVKTKHYGTDTFIMLREDYGSTWRGDINIKNCHFDNTSAFRKIETVKLIFAQWQNHNFGYRTYMPNVFVDGLSFEKKLETKKLIPFFILNFDKELGDVKDFSAASFDGAQNKNVYTAPDFVSLKNIDTDVEISFENEEFFRNTRFETE